MYSILCRCATKSVRYLKILTSIRCLSSTEISTALRPFYFSVHPDLFGQYPTQRTTNENSLKQLSSFIETAQSHRPISPCTVQFYIRENKEIGKFRLVKISLHNRNLREIVNTILKTCNLSTEYLDTISPPPKPKYQPPKQKYTTPKKTPAYDYDLDDLFATIPIKRKIQVAKEALHLGSWLKENYKSAIEKFDSNAPVRKDIEKLTTAICINLGIVEIKWDCGWNETHFRGCLQSFLTLAKEYPECLSLLRDRTLVFSHFTGVSLDGHIMLNSGEVRHNWLDLIKNIRKHDISLGRIPAFEKAVSQVLRDIKVVRRKFMPKIIADEYENNLRQFMTNLSDYCGYRGFPKSWPPSLKTYQIVVETEAGPLMVSPTGQFIVPSSCPGFLLVSFITENLEKAANLIVEYNAHKHVEKSLHIQCVSELNLAALRKDDNVTPELMIKCCEHLLQNKNELTLLKQLHLNISTYYSVLSDGVVCIPWNFKI